MNQKKPEPLFAAQPAHKYCPVCGEVSYSKQGIHPQCAQAQADELQSEQLKAKRKSSISTSSTLFVNPWYKRCPRCGTHLHARKKHCDCGHTFV